MVIGDIASKARSLTNTDSTTYSDASLLIDINLWYQKVATMILASQDDADFDDSNKSDYPIYTTAMVASQRDYQIPQTLKMLQVKRMDFTYDGATWYKATPFDSGMEKRGLGPATASTMEATIDGRYTKQSPSYDIKYNAIWVYPRASTSDVTAGATIKAEFTRQVTEFTSGDLSTGTAIPGFDDPFHAILAYGPAFEYAQAKTLPQANYIAGVLKDYEDRLKKFYGNKDKDFRYTFIPQDAPEDLINR